MLNHSSITIYGIKQNLVGLVQQSRNSAIIMVLTT